MTGQITRKLFTTAAVLALLAFGGLAACGDDDDGGGGGGDAGGDGGGGEDVQAYCDIAAELSEIEGEIPEEQLDQVVEVAPEEIRGDVEVVVEAIRTQDTENADEVVAAQENLSAFEQENCA